MADGEGLNEGRIDTIYGLMAGWLLGGIVKMELEFNKAIPRCHLLTAVYSVVYHTSRDGKRMQRGTESLLRFPEAACDFYFTKVRGYIAEFQ